MGDTMNEILEKLRQAIAKDFGVTMTDTHLTVRHKDGIATFVLDRIVAWDAEECYMCGIPDSGDPVHTLRIGKILNAKVRICPDCLNPQ